MPGNLSVWLDSTKVGDLTNVAGDYTIFAFDDDYRADPNRPILSQSLINALGEPLPRIPRTHTVAPPFFANLLPEEDTLLRHLIARQNSIKIAPDFPFLRVLGEDLPGAVRLVDEGSIAEPPAKPPDYRQSGTQPLRFSLAGMQPKFSASMRANRLTVPVANGTWIVKLPTNTYPRLPENEYAMMRFAAEVGLTVPRIELVDLDSVGNLPSNLPALRQDEPRLAYAIERFDRSNGARIHCEDLNQIAGQFPREKYENKATEYVAEVVGALCPFSDAEELVARVVFGIAIANNDMHLKNWGVIYPGAGQTRLSPLYDFVCTKIYFPDSVLALSVGRERRYDRIGRATMETFADRAQLSLKNTWNVTKQTVERIRDVWPRFKASVSDRRLVETLDRHMEIVPLLSLR